MLRSSVDNGGVIDAASNLCQVTGGNVVELGNLMTARLARCNTAVANMATVIDTHKAMTHALDDPPPPMEHQLGHCRLVVLFIKAPLARRTVPARGDLLATSGRHRPPLVRDGGRQAGPPPLPAAVTAGGVIEVDRIVPQSRGEILR